MSEPKFVYNGEPVRFMNSNAILYDSEGRIIKEPTCKICGKKMNPVMGKSATAWCCNEHGFVK